MSNGWRTKTTWCELPRQPALAECTASDVRDALLDALDDRSFAVQMAARDSLRTLGVEVGGGPNAREVEP